MELARLNESNKNRIFHIALKKAELKRIVNFNKVFDEFKNTLVARNENELIDYMYKYFCNIETICYMIDKGILDERGIRYMKWFIWDNKILFTTDEENNSVDFNDEYRIIFKKAIKKVNFTALMEFDKVFKQMGFNEFDDKNQVFDYIVFYLKQVKKVLILIKQGKITEQQIKSVRWVGW